MTMLTGDDDDNNNKDYYKVHNKLKTSKPQI